MILSSVWQFFSDPVLQAPTIASMLMCLSSAIVGVIVLMRKRSLLGEALSHATYPGVILALLVLSIFFETLRLLPLATAHIHFWVHWWLVMLFCLLLLSFVDSSSAPIFANVLIR